ncbi:MULTISPECIES: hypothetical protein [Asticcacaulis]|uniref:hypothetical protein n=1 Tax=Asticcacaulis TaxID=76890 RepID=UPI001AEB197A|nr:MULTISPECIES: hypothetical protein [Asticcacaulis]MBP2160122.1 hypothetical protein [Asticcacaulis solisilvae]MDR6801167.1 hypothetical protein [Asticcacaulis sp. BE141]
MIRTVILSTIALGLSAGAAVSQPAGTNEQDPAAVLAARMVHIVEIVEKALVAPLADLEKSAREGYARDRLIYGLALKAGRAGPGQEKKAKKWIKKAANSFVGPSRSGPPIRKDEWSSPSPPPPPGRGAGGRAYTHDYSLTGSGSTIDLSTLNPDTILLTEACVDALLMAPDRRANVFACSGEAEYQRLLGLMPKKTS